MDILKSTIDNLSQKEIINYKIYTNRINKGFSRKDIKLFELIRDSKYNDSNEFDYFDTLYKNNSSRNVYAQLRSRLLTEINNSLVQFYFHETDIHYINSELSLYEIYYSKNQWHTAHYHLDKAEVRAIKCQNYVMLFVIYSNFIQLSHHYDSIVPSEYIKKRNETDKILHELKLLEDSIAITLFELKQDQNYTKRKSKALFELEKTHTHLTSKSEYSNNILFRSKLISAYCLILLFKNQYETLESFLISNFEDFISKKLFTKSNHNFKLELLKYICNTLCSNQKNELSIQYLKKFRVSISEYKNLYHDNYIFFYYNSLANNYATLNPTKAIDALDEATTIKAIQKNPRYLGYVFLSISGICFDLKKFKLGINYILRFYNYASLKMISNSLMINIELLEIILNIELKKTEQSLVLIHEKIKKYQPILLNKEFEQEHDFLMVLKTILEDYTISKQFKSSKYAIRFIKKNYKHSNKSIVDYKKWLAEKIVF